MERLGAMVFLTNIHFDTYFFKVCSLSTSAKAWVNSSTATVTKDSPDIIGKDEKGAKPTFIRLLRGCTILIYKGKMLT